MPLVVIGFASASQSTDHGSRHWGKFCHAGASPSLGRDRHRHRAWGHESPDLHLLALILDSSQSRFGLSTRLCFSLTYNSPVSRHHLYISALVSFHVPPADIHLTLLDPSYIRACVLTYLAPKQPDLPLHITNGTPNHQKRAPVVASRATVSGSRHQCSAPYVGPTRLSVTTFRRPRPSRQSLGACNVGSARVQLAHHCRILPRVPRDVGTTSHAGSCLPLLSPLVSLRNPPRTSNPGVPPGPEGETSDQWWRWGQQWPKCSAAEEKA